MSRNTTSTLVVKAPASRVWEALTLPALVKQWQYGSDLVTDWRPGSPIRFRNEWEGQVFEQWGTVQSFDPPRQLSYTLFFPGPGVEDIPSNYFTMTYRLEETAGATTVSITQDDPRPGTGEPEETGENPVLAALRKVIEG
jgi:uncharacterized protein YndB with AHSA1/START domain